MGLKQGQNTTEAGTCLEEVAHFMVIREKREKRSEEEEAQEKSKKTIKGKRWQSEARHNIVLRQDLVR